MASAKANAVRLMDEALALLAADRPLTFREWRRAYTLVEAARHELSADTLDGLSEDERRALFDPATLRQNHETEIP